jgi:hypothetical protein
MGRARSSTAPHRLLSALVLNFTVDSAGDEATTTATTPLGELPPQQPPAPTLQFHAPHPRLSFVML